jgi:hypothetical protein
MGRIYTADELAAMGKGPEADAGMDRHPLTILTSAARYVNRRAELCHNAADWRQWKNAYELLEALMTLVRYTRPER